MARKSVDKNSPEFLERRVSTGRSTMLLIMAFTLVNLIFLMAELGTYFLFSASVPYYLTILCLELEGWDPAGSLVIAALAFSLLILVIYLLCWIFSKRSVGWTVAAAVLFTLDTVALLLVPVLFYISYGEIIMDVLFHILAIVELIQAALAGSKLRRMAAAAPADIRYTDPENF